MAATQVPLCPDLPRTWHASDDLEEYRNSPNSSGPPSTSSFSFLPTWNGRLLGRGTADTTTRRPTLRHFLHRRRQPSLDEPVASRVSRFCIWPLVTFAMVFAIASLLMLLFMLLGQHVPWLHPPHSIVSIRVASTAESGVTVTHTTTTVPHKSEPEQTQHVMDVTLKGRTAAEKAAALEPDTPPDFDLDAYLKWNPELREQGVDTLEKAREHYRLHGRAEHLIYKDFNVTLRYTACGGCMNQVYSHVAALTLAHLTHAKRVIWPAMQERASFNNRFHPNTTLNEQTWQYLDATTLFDVETIQKNFAEKYGIEVVKHPDNPPLPDMAHPETAFQTHSMDFLPHAANMRYTQSVYIARQRPLVLARAIMDAGRNSYMLSGTHPTSLLVDLPCTLFAIDNRGLDVVEDIAKLIAFSPAMQALADKVIKRIHDATGADAFNGIHLRMEKDAADWANIIGGARKYWELYKAAMYRAGLKENPHPLYVASGLLKASKTDEWSRSEMERHSAKFISLGFTKYIVYKELFLTEADLQDVSNEQSGLIDFLVLVKSQKFVGIGVSTFSFYLAELRYMLGSPPEDTTLMMLSYINTDELFFSCGIVAIQTRARLDREHRLPDICRKQNGKPCFRNLR